MGNEQNIILHSLSLHCHSIAPQPILRCAIPFLGMSYSCIYSGPGCTQRTHTWEFNSFKRFSSAHVNLVLATDGLQIFEFGTWLLLFNCVVGVLWWVLHRNLFFTLIALTVESSHSTNPRVVAWGWFGCPSVPCAVQCELHKYWE